MNTYDENTLEFIENPDLEAGCVYRGRKFVAHHPSIEEVYHTEDLAGTSEMNEGRGLKYKVVDIPAKKAWDEFEECYLYHRYTYEEYEAIHAPSDPQVDTRNFVTWDTLAEAYKKGVESV